MRRTLLTLKNFYPPGCRCVPESRTAIMRSRPKIWNRRPHNVVPACQSITLWQAFVLSPGKEVFFEDPRFSLKTEYHAGFTLPHAAVLCLKQIFQNSAAAFFVSGRLRPLHKIISKIRRNYMAFFASAIDTLKILVIALGAGLGAWGVINLLEGYGNDNPGAKSQGMKQLMAGGGIALVGATLIPLLAGLFG